MSHPSRRSFLSIAATLTGLTAVGAAPEAVAGQPAAAPWDLSWLDGLKGQHKQVYDFGSHDFTTDPGPLRFVRNFIETFGEAYGLTPAQLSTAVGISGSAFPMNASDRLWAKYRLGERWKIVDPSTKQPAVRNIFLDGRGNSVKAMQAMGTVFWQCNRALGGVASDLAEGTGQTFAEVRADIIAGLNPGVHLVPSHVLMLALAQERGFTYMKSS